MVVLTSTRVSNESSCEPKHSCAGKNQNVFHRKIFRGERKIFAYGGLTSISFKIGPADGQEEEVRLHLETWTVPELHLRQVSGLRDEQEEEVRLHLGPIYSDFLASILKPTDSAHKTSTCM